MRVSSAMKRRLMDHAVRDLVGYAFDRAIEILNVHRPLHEKTAQLQLQKETLEEEDIAALRAQISPAEAAEATPHQPVAATHRSAHGSHAARSHTRHRSQT